MPKLSVLEVKSKSEPGRYGDGDGLYLHVSPGGRKRWVFIYKDGGSRTEMGLGSVNSVSLKLARELAEQARKDRASGIDPLEARDARDRVRREKREIPTFGDAVKAYLTEHRPGWKNEKHAWQWEHTLTVYAKSLHSMRVTEVDTDAVRRVLTPLFNSIPETARRLRARIEAVLNKARTDNERAFPREWANPARWRGHLENSYRDKAGRLQRGHHPAMPYSEVPSFVAELHAREAVAALALEWTLLTAVRTADALGAVWDEIDIENRLWVIPKDRMKRTREDHRVPLTPRMLAILELVKPLRNGPYVFPGPQPKAPLSNMAMAMLMRRMKRGHLTVHGFRSAFRVWAAENTSFPREVCERALSHKVEGDVERAYQRSDHLEKRRILMAAWDGYCGGSMGVITLNPAS